MDYHKSYASRQNRDIRFDQVRQNAQRPVSFNSINGQQNGNNSFKSAVSSRKRVNIVSFSPNDNGGESLLKTSSSESTEKQRPELRVSRIAKEPQEENFPVYIPVTVDSDASMFNECRMDRLKTPSHQLDVKVDFSPTNIAKDMYKINSDENKMDCLQTNTSINLDENDFEEKSDNVNYNADKKRLLTSFNNKQKRVTYNPRSWQPNSDKNVKLKNLESSNNPIQKKHILDFDDIDDHEPPVLRINRTKTYPVTSSSKPIFKPSLPKTNDEADSDDDHCVTIRPSDIGSFTFSNKTSDPPTSTSDSGVKGCKLTVKRCEKDEPYKCQAKGEVQHSLDDMEYLIDGLAPSNPTNTRTLSALSLGNKCLSASYRNILFNHGLLRKVAENMRDANKDYVTYCDSNSTTKTDSLFNVTENDGVKTKRSLFSSSSFSSSTKTAASIKLNKEMERIRFRVKELLEHIKASKNSSEPPKRGLSKEAFQDFDSRGSGISSLLPKPKSIVPLAMSGNSELSKLKFKHICPHVPLTARDLVIESALNLGLRKSPDWFKNGIRDANMLDTMANLIVGAMDYLKDLENPSHRMDMYSSEALSISLDMFAVDKLRKVFHYTRFLENMTYFSTDNQTHLVRYKEGKLIVYLVRCVRMCAAHLPRHPAPSNYWSQCKSQNKEDAADQCSEDINDPLKVAEQMREKYPPLITLSSDQKVVLDCLLRTFRLLVNVSYNEYVSDILGSCSDLLEVTLDCLLHIPNRLPTGRGFDLSVLAFCLLANICQHCPENRSRIVHLELPTYTYDDKKSELHEENDEIKLWKQDKRTTHVFDEIISELAKNHDFEKDDDSVSRPVELPPPVPAENAPSTLEVTDSGRLQRPAPPPSLYDTPDLVMSSMKPTEPPSGGENWQKEGDTIEEAGLKWRLIRGKTHPKGSMKGSSRSRKRLRFDKGSDDDDDDTDLDTEEDSDCENGSSDELDFPNRDTSGECDEEEDDFGGGGADVEFLTETQEEKDKLAQTMTSARQHMDDSLVAACAALLLGCIMQTSPRYTERIRQKLPDGKFRPLAIMLAKLLSFLSLTKAFQTSGSESIARIVNILESQDMKSTVSMNELSNTKSISLSD